VANLYIIRGVPGSGKTTLADRMKSCGMIWDYAEADSFMVDECGNYRFDPKRLSHCHKKCHIEVRDMMRAGYDGIAVSNTFTRKWEMENYIGLARQFGYDVTMIVCQGDYGNVHGVPADKVQQMRDRFEY
jgi:predicted kinase